MKKSIIVLSHIIFWILVLTVELVPITTVNDPEKVNIILVEEAFVMPLSMIVFYIFYLGIAPILFSKKRIVQFLVVFILTVSLYTFLVMQFLPKVLFMVIDPPKEEISMVRWYMSSFTYHFIYALWGTMFRFTLDWFKSNQKQKDLEKQNMMNELALLRSQVNPHFLFNTLNNIHSFVSREPDKASTGIVKLSEIMRYMLYEANIDKVPLENEVNYIRNYIQLQQLRLKDPGFVRFTVDGELGNHTIPPLLLVPFIENAFKHSKKNVSSPGIIIEIQIKENYLKFETSNTIGTAEESLVSQSGFGLKNIHRRLELLYGKNYMLRIFTQGEIFYVQLEITNYENQVYSS